MRSCGMQQVAQHILGADGRTVCTSVCAESYVVCCCAETLKLSVRQPRTTAALQCEDPTKTKIEVGSSL